MDFSKNLISLIIPTYKGSETLSKLIEELILIFKDHKIEIVIVNDCSPDNTHEDCINLFRKYPDKIIYLKLSKNFGEHNAVIAGLRHSEGDLVIIMDDDYQNAPDETFKLAEYSLKNNYDAVFTKYRVKKDSFIRNLMSKIANISAQLILKKPKEIYFSSFKSIKKNLVNEIIKYKGPYPYIDGLILSVTQNIGSYEVAHAERKQGKSSYSLYKLAKHYGNLITNFSTMPIHLFSIMGFVITIVSFVFIISIIIEKIFNPDVPLGYSTLITVIIFFSGVQILFLGLIGEYVGKILKNVNNENQYTISFLRKKDKES
jgi:undecaprenyl-phosphate 4-deoxy-4-formamido-L-arabinose transferase